MNAKVRPLHALCSLHSLESDPLLSLISTRLATMPGRSSAASHTPSSPVGRAARLPAAVRLFEVQWEEIQLVRQIGKVSGVERAWWLSRGSKREAGQLT